MAISFGTQNSTTNTQQQSQSEPWAPTIPYLTRFLQDSDNLRSLLGPSGDQLDAFGKLKQNAAAGNPFAGQISNLANDTFNATSRSGVADNAYKTLQSQLGDYASGKYLDFSNNPYITQMLKTVGDDVQNRVQQQFAGAGRDISGNAYGQLALGRGITQAQLPILSDLYQKANQQRIDAANSLYGAGTTNAQLGQSLDTSALNTRAGAVPISNEAVNAQNFGPNQILNLDQQLKGLPFDDMSMYANLLLPVSGLGGQQAGKGTSNTSSTGFGISLSDARLKDDMGTVGHLADGTPLHLFKYLGDDDPHIGAMAQEVEITNPKAVVQTGVGDIKAVDYDALIEKARRVFQKKGRRQ